MATPTDIAWIVSVMSAAYPTWNPTELTNEVYFQSLHDLDPEELKMATMHCINEPGRKFAPSVGEIRGTVAELRAMTVNLPSAYEAWQEVITQLRDNGGDFGKPVWSHPLVERAMKSIGWRELRLSENQTADRSRFIQCYEQLVDRVSREDIMLPEVRGYVEVNGARLLAPADQMKLLTDKLSVNREKANR